MFGGRSLSDGRLEVADLFQECRVAGQLEPARFHIDSLVGIPTALVGKLIAFVNSSLKFSTQHSRMSSIAASP